MESSATPGADLRHRHHRRRRQRLRNRQRRRRTRLVGLPLRKRRSRLLDLERFEQADSWRLALFGAFQVSFGSRSAHRARSSVANRTPYRVAASLRAAPPYGSQTRLAASDRPFSLRPSRRPPPFAANPNAPTGRRSGGRTAQAAIYAWVRIFGLLGRRRAARRPECARRGRQGRRHRAPHALPERRPRGRSVDPDRAGRTQRADSARFERARWSTRPGLGSARSCSRRSRSRPPPPSGWSRAVTSSWGDCFSTTAATSSKTRTGGCFSSCRSNETTR